jgi:hypothetical protein
MPQVGKKKFAYYSKLVKRKLKYMQKNQNRKLKKVRLWEREQASGDWKDKGKEF